ncbi:MAG: Gfo/Idh/MocA family oxidoreductase [Pseudotabrizicola sp.]|uniref:Gfo/Idh/MocA family protein n=1 Tax=Pseudotabrizicola sp. TaxID=2939647 RepID=UPI00271BF5EE|nr:Gfo/Idh/MocA family oxidoreductase [Pseudotabrizicola sp.]MDO8882235.1 Gfo/Idh/MocA family oxidoreductase [Pseudotabrizicola sp.]MDP2080314.1 Gfo/Idh/MocA family oxidoreductase [Pseudotabrizicola sp.]MDZ7572363.1 Gfo/Idh/MocA family oxidoreductase [Pseudotabrizicola sp.]
MTIRILIIGTGGMANTHAESFARIDGVDLVAGVDTRPDQLAAFCEKHSIANRFATIAEAISWGQFDAVTNVTPDAVHFVTTIPVLAAGKHVLCEKPLATSAADAEAMMVAAQTAGVVNMVNLSYRNGAALQQAAQMVAQGAIGKVRHFEASYLQSWLTQPAWGEWSEQPQWLWRLSTAHGSKGVLGDVGIHILDFATFIAGEAAADVSARLATFDKAPGGVIGDYTLDANDSVTMQIRLEGGALGVVHATRFATGHLNDLRLRIFGDLGGLEVGFENNISHLRACIGEDRLTATWADIDCPPTPSIYERFVAAIRGQSPATPDFARGVMLQRLLDRAEQSAAQAGLVLPV